jgi:hypothetical protein
MFNLYSLHMHRHLARRLGSAAGTLQIINPTPTILLHTTTVAAHLTMSFLKTQPAWLLLAIASGGCAAFNGVFAKLYCCTPIHPMSTQILTTHAAPPQSSQHHGRAP